MIPPLRTACLLILACAFIAPGCTTPRGHDLAAGTARRMSDLSKTCEALSSHVGQTTGSLQSVIANARQDPREAFAAYSRNLDGLEKLVRGAGESRAAIDKDGRKYFEEWDKRNRTIGDESLRKKADSRRNEVQAAFVKTEKRLDLVLDELRGFVGQLQDVRAYLSSDLSSAGIESLRGRIGDLGSKGRTIQKELLDVNSMAQKLLPDLGSNAKDTAASEDRAEEPRVVR